MADPGWATAWPGLPSWARAWDDNEAIPVACDVAVDAGQIAQASYAASSSFSRIDGSVSHTSIVS